MPSGIESRRNNALTAFLTLEALILFVGAPLSAHGFQAPTVAAGLLGILLLLVIVFISHSPVARAIIVAASIMAVTGGVLRTSAPSVLTVWLGHLAALLALLGVSIVIVQAVFAPGRITHHRIAGALILYLNLAVGFTSIYRLIQELNPAAFANLPIHETETLAVINMLYFSFTTLTSTGFGEILPVDPFARSMANLEAVAGQLYLAILLARLVTMHVEARRTNTMSQDP
jgi:hypothetical protein